MAESIVRPANNPHSLENKVQWDYSGKWDTHKKCKNYIEYRYVFATCKKNLERYLMYVLMYEK